MKTFSFMKVKKMLFKNDFVPCFGEKRFKSRRICLQIKTGIHS